MSYDEDYYEMHHLLIESLTLAFIMVFGKIKTGPQWQVS